MGIQPIDGQGALSQPSYTMPNGTDKAGAASPSAAKTADSTIRSVKGQVPASATQALEKATQQAQARLKEAGSSLSFSIDKESGKTVVKLIDPDTQEVIRQIPSKEMLEISHNLDKAIQGMLISQKV